MTRMRKISYLAMFLMFVFSVISVSAQSGEGLSQTRSNVESSAAYFTVTFAAEGQESFTQMVEEGEPLTLPQGQDLAGRVFIGWESNGEFLTDGMTVTRDITATAVYSAAAIDAQIRYISVLDEGDQLLSTFDVQLTAEDVAEQPFRVDSPKNFEVDGRTLLPDVPYVLITAEALSTVIEQGLSVYTDTVTYGPADMRYTLVSFTADPEGVEEWVEAGREELDGRMGAVVSAPEENEYGVLDHVENSLLTENLQEVQAYYVADAADSMLTEASVKALWDDGEDQDGIRPESLTVVLSNGTEAILNEENEWTVTIENLPLFANDIAVVYSWVENEIPEGYELSDIVTEGMTTTLTNSHEPEETQATIVKVWDDRDNAAGLRPESLTVSLSEGTDVVLNEENGWTATVENLPKYADGEEIEYSWTEDEEGVTGGYKLSDTSISGTVTTLTNTLALKDIPVTSVWADVNNNDGLRPGTVTLHLLADGKEVRTEELSGVTNIWSLTFEDLPVHNSAGEEIKYELTEDEVAEYETGIEYSDEEGFTITNLHDPVRIEIHVTKIWDDNENNDGTRPDHIILELFADDEENGFAFVREEDEWEWLFPDLPKYSNGKEIEYTLEEEPVKGYSTFIVGDQREGFTVTNTHVDETRDVMVTKVWDDNNDWDGIRPESVMVTLLANGEVVDTVEMTGTGNRWTYTFQDLPVNVDGEQIVYTVEEEPVEGYENTIRGTTIRSYHLPEYTLTIHYRYQSNKRTAMPTYTAVYKAGESYEVETPHISGYKSTINVVKGTQPHRNLEFVVYYFKPAPAQPAEEPEVEEAPVIAPVQGIVIDEFGVPLGIGTVSLNAGDCFE